MTENLTPPSERKRFAQYGSRYRVLAAVTLAGTATALLFIVLHWFQEMAENRTSVESNLEAVADMKLELLMGWREQRLGDAGFLHGSPNAARLVTELIANPPTESATAMGQDWLKRMTESWGYAQATLLRADGSVVLSVAARPDNVKPLSADQIREALVARKPTLTDLREDEDGELHLEVVVPILAKSDSQPIATIVLKIDPRQSLFPLVSAWPGKSESAETLIAIRRGDEIVYASPLRNEPASRRRPHFPIGSPEIPGELTFRDRERLVDGRDYRGVPVLEVTRLIPKTNWLLVVKVDRSELLERARRESVHISLLAVGLVVSVFACFGWLWRRREAAVLAAELSSREALQENQQALAAIGAQLQGLVQTAMDAIITVDDQQRIVLFNPAAEELFGYSEGEVLGQPLERLLPEGFREVHRGHVESFAAKHETRRRFGSLGNVMGLRANGEQFPVEVSISRIETGGRVCFSAIMRDITDRLKAEASLRDREDRLRTLGDNIPSGMIYQLVAEPNGRKRFVYMSSGVKQIFGMTAEQVVADAEPFWNLMFDEDRRLLEAAEDESEHSLTPFHLEFRQHTVKGDVRWIHARSSPRKLPDGKVVWDGVAVDITDRKHAEQLAQERFELQESIGRTVPGVLYTFRLRTDGSSHFPYASPTILNQFGMEASELARDAAPFFARVHSDDRPGLLASISKSSRTLADWAHEFRYDHPERGYIWVMAKSTPLREPDGSTLWHGFSMDISDLRTAEAALRESEKRFRTTLEEMMEGCQIIDFQWRYRYLNKAAVAYARRPLEDLIGRTMMEAYPGIENTELFHQLQRAMEERVASKIEAEFVYPDGARAWFQSFFQPAPEGIFILSLDITEQKRTEVLEKHRRDSLELLTTGAPLRKVLDCLVAGLEQQHEEWLCSILLIDESGRRFRIGAAGRLSAEYTATVAGIEIGPTVGSCGAAISRREIVVTEDIMTDPNWADFRDLAARARLRACWSVPIFSKAKQVLGTLAVYFSTPRRPIAGELESLTSAAQFASIAIEQRRYEEALERERGSLKRLVQTMPDLVWLKDPDGIFLACNPRFEQLFGASEADIIGKKDVDFVDAATAAAFHENDLATIAQGSPRTNIEELTFASDGHREWTETVKTPMFGPNGKLIGVLGVGRDISVRLNMEAALREREQQLQLFVEHAPAAIAMLDRDLRYIVASRRWLTDHDCEGQELRGRPYSEVSSEFPEPWKERLVRCLAGAVERSEEDRYMGSDGSVRWVRWEGRPWYSEPGHIGGVIIFSEDITARKLGQQALEDSQERFRELAENVTEVFWITDPGGARVFYLNPAFEKVWGRSCDSVYAEPGLWHLAVHPNDRAQLQEALRVRMPEGGFDETYRIIRPDGTERWIHDRGFPVRDPEGHIVRLVGVAEDVTESRKLETQYRQAQKMEAIGQLASGVAHDFNNILSVITIHTDLMTNKLSMDDPNRESLMDIQRAAERAAALTRQLLVFSRQEVVEPKVIDLNVAVVDSEKMLGRLIGEDVRLETSLGPALRRVRIDAGHLGQVIMNLVVNARDAMPRGGRLIIETRNVDLDEDYARAHPEARPGAYVQLAVSDNGSGIPPDVLAHIWEPFFTTKGAGHGTGLGLAVVHGIVKQAGGHLSVYSVVGAGTTFKIYLPAIVSDASLSSTSEKSQLKSGKETILLVDDEDSFRRVGTAGLRHLGYTVLAASDGTQALKLAAEYNGTIHLLITDVVMPGQGGRAVAEEILAARPGIKVLFQSGYTDDAVVRHGVLQAEVAFLQKPFTLAALAMKVREVLDQ